MRTWPADWEDRRRGLNCPACADGRAERIAIGDRVFAGRVADAYLHRDQAARGYTLVVWRGRHVADPTEISSDEACAFADEVRLVSLGIEEVYRPAKLNYLTLGNLMPHLHTHIVPRYLDDPDPERPPRFMMIDQAWPPIPEDDYGQQVADLRSSIVRLQTES
jgi:diadenosine tetraphosphate (Ap4A) HIT family hydrolase